MGTHYRKKITFNYDILDSARSAYQRLKKHIYEIKKNIDLDDGPRAVESSGIYKQRFIESINDDLNIPQALAVMWDVIRSGIFEIEKFSLIMDFDKVFGLNLAEAKEKEIDVPNEIIKLVEERTNAKLSKDFKRADEIRKKIKEMGYELLDKKDGVEIKKI